MQQLFDGLRSKLLVEPQEVDDNEELIPDFTLVAPPKGPAIPAAVLIGMVRRGQNLSVLYTERSSKLRAHSGQIAFPGGKIDAGDAGPGAAAVREAFEEVSVQPSDVEVLGYLPYLYTGTNFLITPVVALVEPSGPFEANPDEVESFFEVPFEVLQNNDSYSTFDVTRGALSHKSWRIQHDDRDIWGITAGITRRFYEIALSGEVR